jgi:hypothetical protein
MKLYHGTSARHLDAVLANGLMPRGKSKSLWKHAPSHSKCVYLTDSYAPYFMCQATRKGEAGLVVEVDTERMGLGCLVPDEDALEQVLRGRDSVEGDMNRRTTHYRRRLEDYRWHPDTWQASLRALGTCAHWGPVPTQAITRLAVVPEGSIHHFLYNWDASISLINQRICGPGYKLQMRRMFGDEPTEAELAADAIGRGWKIEIPEIEITELSNGAVTGKRLHSAPEERVRPTLQTMELSA